MKWRMEPVMEASNPRGEFRGRHAAVIMACCLTCGMPAAMILSTAGLFYPVIASDLDVPTAEISAWMSVSMLSSAFLSPFVGNLIARYSVRNFMLLGVFACGVAFVMFSLGNHPWVFWLGGGVAGFSLVTCLSLIPSVLLNRWFSKHVGLAIGVCTSFTGIGGVVFLALGQGLIDAYGWRVAYLAFACIAVAVCVPAVLFAVRERPSDCGLSPYGACEEVVDEPVASGGEQVVARGVDAAPVPTDSIGCALRRSSAQGRPGAHSGAMPWRRAAVRAGGGLWRRRAPVAGFAAGRHARASGPPGGMDAALRTPAFWLLVGSGLFMNLVSQVNGYFPLYVDWLDQQAAYGVMAGSYTTGAVLLGLSQVGNAAGKVTLGAAIDVSPGKALALLSACGALGVGCVWLAPSTPLMAFGGLVFGFFIAGGLVLLPMLVRRVFGSGEGFGTILSRVQVAPTAGSAIGNVAFPLMAESSLGFASMFAASLVCVVLVLLFSLLALRYRPGMEGPPAQA